MFGNTKPRILFAISNLAYGGIQTQAVTLAKEFQKKGAKIYFLYTEKYEETFVKNELTANNFKVLKGHFIFNQFWKKYSWRLYKHAPLMRIKILLWFYGIDYVIPYQTKLSILFCAAHKNSGVKKTIFHIRNTIIENEPKNNWYLHQALKNEPSIITNSNHARLKFIQLYGKKYSLNIQTIYNGVSIRPIDTSINWKKYFQVESVQFVVTVLANFFEEKNFETVFKAWKVFIKQTNLNANLILAGDEGVKGKREQYKKYVAELGIQDSVIFLGRIPYNIELLSISNCNILSTYNEGLPNSVIETLAMGVPFIGSDVDGVREVVGDDYPIPLFPNGDYKKLKEMLLKVYNKEFNLQQLRTYSLKRYEFFNTNKLIENYSKIIKL